MSKEMDAFATKHRHLPVENRKLGAVSKSITTEEILRDPDFPEAAKAWLRAARKDPRNIHNPPNFVTNEGCWEKAKRAAAHADADDVYAFATYWYQQNCK
jgi:hypothetical protein